jgi:hypothetical protein
VAVVEGADLRGRGAVEPGAPGVEAVIQEVPGTPPPNFASPVAG